MSTVSPTTVEFRKSCHARSNMRDGRRRAAVATVVQYRLTERCGTRENNPYRLYLISEALAGLTLHNANLSTVIEAPALRLSQLNARAVFGRAKV